MLSNDKISTGLSDKLYSSYIIRLLNPSRDPILSLGLNEFADSGSVISMILPNVLKLGSILNALSASVK